MGYGFLTLGFSFLAFWMARHYFAQLRAPRTWPTVPGRVLEKRVGERPLGRGIHYLAYARFTYRVGDTDYENDQVYAIAQTTNRLWAVERFIDRLPTELPVHYNPKNPAQSFLILNPQWMGWLAVAMGVFLLPVALTWFVTG